jgi:predicted amidohydrolase
MIVDAMGEVLYSRAHHEDIYTIELQKEKLDDIRNKLPFLRDADRFFIEL